VAGIAVAGAALVGNGHQGGGPNASAAANGSTRGAAATTPNHESWSQAVDATTALAGARRAGDRAWFDPIRRRLRDNGMGHSPDAAAEGSAEFAAHRLAHPARKFTVTTDAMIPTGAEVGIELRGRAGSGFWSEWAPADSHGRVKLPRPVDTAQLRVVMTPGLRRARPAVRSVSVTARPSRTPMRAPERHPAYGARIFATREGLVGGRTANGSVIQPNDHFVALPSRRALSSNGGGEYTVRVCANGRCDLAPVRDVGPWNIRDNHWWRPRDQWNKLKRGLPQAQAAYEKGFNGGRDGFGRRVLNPAGIDLGDGTARETLAVNDGGWVHVTYLWTGVYPQNVTIHSMKKYRKVTMYRGPSRQAAFAGYAVDGVRVGMTCQTPGPAARGRFGTSRLWDHIGPHLYVPHSYVDRTNTQTLRTCRPDE